MDIINRDLPAGGSKPNEPKKIVVHSMGNYIKDPNPEHAADFLERYGLSAHALIDYTGTVFVCRQDTQRAYHARGHNTDTLGVEFLVQGEHDYASFIKAIAIPGWVTPDQWEAGVKWVNNWMRSWQITEVVRHSDISPGRKVDPGAGFDWEKFRKDIVVG